MREQTQYTTMLPIYNIPTDMQAPFDSPFSVQPGPVEPWSAAPANHSAQAHAGHTMYHSSCSALLV